MSSRGHLFLRHLVVFCLSGGPPKLKPTLLPLMLMLASALMWMWKPFVELGVLRATGETSNSVMHAGSPAVQKAWVALRLLQRQQSLVRRRRVGFRLGVCRCRLGAAFVMVSLLAV